MDSELSRQLLLDDCFQFVRLERATIDFWWPCLRCRNMPVLQSVLDAWSPSKDRDSIKVGLLHYGAHLPESFSWGVAFLLGAAPPIERCIFDSDPTVKPLTFVPFAENIARLSVVYNECRDDFLKAVKDTSLIDG
jgi:hypothetical protein